MDELTEPLKIVKASLDSNIPGKSLLLILQENRTKIDNASPLHS